MANRMRRGNAAATYAARMTEEVEPTEDERKLADDIVVDDLAEDDEPEVEEPSEPSPAADYSHEEDDGDDDGEDEPAAEEDAIKALERQLAELRGEIQTQNQRTAQSAEAAELESQRALIRNGLRQVKADHAAAQQKFAEASAKGEWQEAAKAQSEIAQAVADIREFEGAADELSTQIEKFNKKVTQQPAPKPAAEGDQFEVAIAKMSDASKDWCRSHKADLQRSPARGMKAQAAHIEAVESGLKVDTPEYFKFLDKQMGYETVTKKQGKPSGKPRVAAPGGSRSEPTSGSLSEIKLSRAEVEMAKTMGMTTKEYALQKKELIQNGRDPARSGPRYSANTQANRR